MIAPFEFLATVALVLTAASASPLEKRATVIADGNGYKTGALSNTLWWQSSGSLIRGNCPSKVQIGDCFQVLLKSSGNLERRDETDSTSLPTSDAYHPDSKSLLDVRDLGAEFEEEEEEKETSAPADISALVKRGSARQRIELYSMPVAASGQTWLFTWKSYLARGTSTSGSFFHLMQLLRRDGSGGPVMTVDAKNGMAVVMDSIRGCTKCSSIPISSFTGRTVAHSLTVKFGSSGTLNYRATDVNGGKQLLAYSAKGEMGSSASIKAGAYRAVAGGMSNVESYVGDFNFRRL